MKDKYKGTILTKILSNTCLAVIFANKRKNKAIGRIKKLIISIIIKKGANIKGIPSGHKWEKNLFILYTLGKKLNLKKKERDINKQK